MPQNRPKIAFISTMEGSVWGGSEELWSQTALLLLKQGYQVIASVKGWPETPWQLKTVQEAGCQVERRQRAGIAQRFANKLVRQLRLPSQKWLTELKPDFVVISQGDPYSGVGWAEQCHHQHIPYALIVHAAAEHWWPDDALAARAARCYESAAASYFVSQGNLEMVRTQLAIPLNAAKVVRNPFNVPYEAPVAWPEDEETLRLACVGRLEPFAKGQDILFDVLKEEKWKQRPLAISLYGNGQNYATLIRLKERLGLEKVIFQGFTNSIEGIWKTHHALILPSRHEGLPIAVVEAMLCGRPGIVTDVAGNAELLEDGITGFIATAPARLHLDEALERAWTHRDQLKQMGQRAAERVRQQIPADPAAVFAAELLDLIHSAR